MQTLPKMKSWNIRKETSAYTKINEMCYSNCWGGIPAAIKSGLCQKNV